MDAETVEKIAAEAHYELVKSGYDPPTPVQFNVPPGAISGDGFNYVIEFPGSLVDKMERERQADRKAGGDEAVRKMLEATGYVPPNQAANGIETPSVQPTRMPQPKPQLLPVLHAAALACLDALTHLAGRTIRPDNTEADVFAELRAALNTVPTHAKDPFAGTAIVEAWGKYDTSWHALVCSTARDWLERLPANLADARTLGQTSCLPNLFPEPAKVRAELEAEVQRISRLDIGLYNAGTGRTEPAAVQVAGGMAPQTEAHAPAKRKPAKKATINARMIDALQAQPDAIGWTCQQWSKHLKCSPAAIVGTNTWKSIKLDREKGKAERASKRAREKRKM